uniref:RP9 pre-mRNA splicing factor n=1 Tax=Hippocampus comes TaxID=109280 RepID=A0A3Q3DZ71_HIPCM
MSSRKRPREKEERREHKRHKSTSKEDDEKLKSQMKRLNQQVQNLKHIETFFDLQEHMEKPEDCIPAEPGNEDARTFLANAPTKGLWMPLGKEVKVMQCWRCKRYGHRTGDRECPFFIKGNQKLEQFRVAHEDPMYDLIRENERNEKESRIQQLQQLLQDTTSSSSSSDSDGGKKKKKKKEKKKKKKKKKRKKHKHASSSSESD